VLARQQALPPTTGLLAAVAAQQGVQCGLAVFFGAWRALDGPATLRAGLAGRVFFSERVHGGGIGAPRLFGWARKDLSRETRNWPRL
jgi:hypothetical protein